MEEKPHSPEDLQARIDQARGVSPAEEVKVDTGMAAAMRMSIELLAGALVGLAIGYFLDRWLDSSPWLTILCFFIGCIAGFRNVRRSSELLDKGGDSAKTPRA